MKKLSQLFAVLSALIFPGFAFAVASGNNSFNLHATTSIAGIVSIIIFVIAYAIVMSEEVLLMRKSKPVVLAAGIIWALVAWHAHKLNLGDSVNAMVRHNLLEYAELFLFLLVAMTYINALEERRVFEWLRSWLIQRGFNYRQLFWVTGVLAFFISPIADNLTTALVMCAVVLAVGADNPRFVSVACVNIVVAANAGGAFSPFGDITTLMVWQAGKLPFSDFFQIFVPSVVSFLIPAVVMNFAISQQKPSTNQQICKMKLGAKRIVLLFLATIVTAVLFHNQLHLPPAVGMMTGLGYLKFFAYYIKKNEQVLNGMLHVENPTTFDIFRKVELVEWDTLLFFYGVVLSVGGLATFGYLELASKFLYTDLGANFSAIHSATPANIIVGFLSAIVDNIPVMFAVLTMNPSMSEGQWLLVTLTAGIGGSMLSIGSAAGVALMGQAKGYYTFLSHLKWSWVILIGYLAAVFSHIWLNHELFSKALT
ncbi:MAG: sodium:proton antiporter NhaD [Gammaproteobacteria bacterium]